MDLSRYGGAASGAVLAVPGAVSGAAHGRDERTQRVASSGFGRGAVRSDLDEIFRRDYQRVVDVAARVPTAAHVSATNARYLAAKVTRHAHTIELPIGELRP